MIATNCHFFSQVVPDLPSVPPAVTMGNLGPPQMVPSGDLVHGIDTAEVCLCVCLSVTNR